MKLIVLSSLALSMMTVGAAAQVSSGSQSGAQAIIHGSTSISKFNQVPGAGAIGTTMSASPYNCSNGAGIGVPYFSFTGPVESESCAATVAALAYLQCGKDRTCKAILAGNKYARQGMVATGEVVEAGAVARQAVPAPTAYASGKARASYQDRNSPYYSPNLRD